MFPTKALSQKTLEPQELKADKKACRKIGPCGVGKKALYLNSFYIDRCYYIPYGAITRVFKRVAMSKGGFTGKGLFATMPYLVVVYDNGQEKQCNFKHEEHVDEILELIEKDHPRIKTLSAEGERKRAERLAAEAARPKPVLTKEAQAEVDHLKAAREYLEKRPSLYQKLSRDAKAKRVNERSNPAYRWVALTIVLMGLVAAAYGIWSLITKAEFGIYFTLFGFAAVFFFAGANVLPTKRNNKRYIEQQWVDTCAAMLQHIKTFDDGGRKFPVPEYYAHPNTLTRMIRVIEEGKIQTTDAALDRVKKDLKAINSDVTVEQEEFDEIMAIKPMFLVSDYE